MFKEVEVNQLFISTFGQLELYAVSEVKRQCGIFWKLRTNPILSLRPGTLKSCSLGK